MAVGFLVAAHPQTIHIAMSMDLYKVSLSMAWLTVSISSKLRHLLFPCQAPPRRHGLQIVRSDQKAVAPSAIPILRRRRKFAKITIILIDLGRKWFMSKPCFASSSHQPVPCPLSPVPAPSSAGSSSALISAGFRRCLPRYWRSCRPPGLPPYWGVAASSIQHPAAAGRPGPAGGSP